MGVDRFGLVLDVMDLERLLRRKILQRGTRLRGEPVARGWDSIPVWIVEGMSQLGGERGRFGRG